MTETDWDASNDPLAMYRLLRESTTLLRTRWQGRVPVRRFHFTERQDALFRYAVSERLMGIVQSGTAHRLLESLRMDLQSETPPRSGFGQHRWYQSFLQEATAQHPAEVATAWSALRILLAHEETRRDEGLFLAAVAQADFAAHNGDMWQRARVLEAEKIAQAELLREFVGNPFHTLQLPEDWERWQDGLIGEMARRIDRDGDFQALPVLGDALEDAGCSDAHLLQHCRGNGPHQHGCWVVDLLRARN